MGIVLPDDHLGVVRLAVEMLDQRVEGAGHVLVAEVPRGDLGPVHLVVVLLGVADQSGVLLGVELLVLGHPTVPSEVQLRSPPQLQELGHHFVLARGGPLVDDRVSVGLALDVDMVEARVAPPCHLGLGGVDLLEVADDRLNRGTQAVEVEPVEAGLAAGWVWASLRARSHWTKPSTSRFRHIQVGKRRKPPERHRRPRRTTCPSHTG